jgi:cellulose synthase/poly-beta-1,6-N-acetylglucosamine synthase-like glycosyltransferase
VEELARQAVRTGRPVQALYLMAQPVTPRGRDLVSALAFMVKNLVRPAGLKRAGLPCLLTGSGMAFPWGLIRRAHLATGNTVEDMQLGLDMALAGAPPIFCDRARVTGRLPSSAAAARSQRTRWEHGHLRTLRRELPRLLSAGVRHRRAGVLALALDLCVPPLSLLVMAWIVVTAVAGLGAVVAGANYWALLTMLIGSAIMMLTLLGVWFKYARLTLPLASLLAAPLYLLWKIPLYVGIALRPQAGWVRTPRDLPQQI